MSDEEDVVVTTGLQAARTKVLIKLNLPSMKTFQIYLKIEDFDYWITDTAPDPDLVEALKDKSNDFI